MKQICICLIKNFLVLFISILLFSCKKNEGPILNDNQIFIGDYSNMIVNNYDTILMGGYHNLQQLDLDVNNDLSPDFRLSSEIWGSPGLGQNPRSIISCLNLNSFLFGYTKNDTTFLNKTTNEWMSQGVYQIHKNENLSCHRISDKDSIISITKNNFKILPLIIKDKMNKNDVFKSDTVTLIEDSYSYPSILISGYMTDTVTFRRTFILNDCNSFPEEIGYVGIKVRHNNVDKLGWIKLGITDKYKILILETALQE